MRNGSRHLDRRLAADEHAVQPGGIRRLLAIDTATIRLIHAAAMDEGKLHGPPLLR
ncbi:MAG: hypothetical protein ACR2QH_04435 [Geminicoccaceae bacterium]